jgi:hypothetical protein
LVFGTQLRTNRKRNDERGRRKEKNEAEEGEKSNKEK